MKRLFIFGNGASIAEGAPLWSKLISEMLKIDRKKVDDIIKERNLGNENIELINKNLVRSHELLNEFLYTFFKMHREFEPSFNDIFPLLQILSDNK